MSQSSKYLERLRLFYFYQHDTLTDQDFLKKLRGIVPLQMGIFIVIGIALLITIQYSHSQGQKMLLFMAGLAHLLLAISHFRTLKRIKHILKEYE